MAIFDTNVQQDKLSVSDESKWTQRCSDSRILSLRVGFKLKTAILIPNEQECEAEHTWLTYVARVYISRSSWSWARFHISCLLWALKSRSKKRTRISWIDLSISITWFQVLLIHLTRKTWLNKWLYLVYILQEMSKLLSFSFLWSHEFNIYELET